ncbi:NADH:flavin oxidoreductase [Aromatoleum toluclasticum]|uniref:NADH:flavin oxidoreductase n=1 Tax=Aromatoleum toluclasticum TaxID=92003 RepID=UPI001D195CAF|nr:NADH:flavin oxidoreductase [Aromatoleum toluclasticum]MCC4114732.1 NADH:flavin oxidoreductase [Aromatoleum toluclasticum]
MTSATDSLFRSFTLNGLVLPNRVVMAPMTRWKSPGGVPGPNVAAYYRRRAEHSCGLIITEGTTVDHPVSSHSTRIPNFFGEALDGWRRVVDEVHAVGGRIVPPLWHVGAARHPSQDSPNRHLPIASPSGLYAPDKPARGEPMTKAEIGGVVRAFARAAADARAIGFDGIEIHGAHGYLIDQFFWAALNRRDDEYGGGPEGRMRFAIEIVEAIRREVGDDFPIVFRVSQWKQQDYAAKVAETPKALAGWLRPLPEAGVDAFHCSQRRFWEPEFDGSSLNLAGWAKKLTGKPVITVGSIGLKKELVAGSLENLGCVAEVAALDGLLERLAQEEFDLVAVGRGMLADPEWTRKVSDGRIGDLRPYGAEALETLI